MPVETPRDLDLRYARTLEEALAGRDDGYEPIECSFGSRSVIGPLGLDHHGELSHEEPVSLKAARIALARTDGRRHRFLFAGMPDADAIYAALVLSGLIAPSLELGAAIGELDLDPIGIDRRVEPHVRGPAFERHGLFALSLDGFRRALDAGAGVFGPEPLSESVLEEARRYEAGRLEKAGGAVVARDGEVLFVVSDDPSRDVWHRSAAVVVQYKPTLKVITVSGCSEQGAARLGRRSVFAVLGAEGLRPVYTLVDEVLGATGSGGRPDIGGSPRGRPVGRDEADRVHAAVVRLVARS